MARMGRPPKYKTDEERKQARNKQIHKYSKGAYERLQELVPIGTNDKLKGAAAIEEVSKRQYLLSAIEDRLEKTEKLFKKD